MHLASQHLLIVLRTVNHLFQQSRRCCEAASHLLGKWSLTCC